MADPTPFVPGYSYTDYQETAPADPLPGPQVDNDFADVATSTVTLVNAVKDVRRSDGALKNGIVTYDSLAASVKALLNNLGTAIIPGTLLIEQFGAKGGAVDDSAAFAAALASGQPVLLLDTRGYTIKNVPTGDTGGHLYALAPGGITLTIEDGESGFLMQGKFSVSNVKIIGDPLYHFQHDAGAGSIADVTLVGVEMVGGTFGLYTFGYGQMPRRIKTLGCIFSDVENPCFFEAIADSVIGLGCSFSGASGSNVLIKMGQNNRIGGDCSVDGGVTGVRFLGGFSNSGFLSGTFEGNTVFDISVKNVLEEAVSFDVNGSSAADVLAREVALIASKNTQTISGIDYYVVTLAGGAAWNSASGVFANAYMVPNTGACVGGAYKATTNAAGAFYFVQGVQMSAAAYAALALGDEMVIGLPFLQNEVYGITVDGVTGADHYGIGVLLYGLCIGNTVRDNRVRFDRTVKTDDARGVGVQSLSGINGAGSYVSSTGDQRKAPNHGNLLDANKAYGCDVVLDYNDFGGATTPYVSYGNRTRGNGVLGGALTIADHVNYSDGDWIVA